MPFDRHPAHRAIAVTSMSPRPPSWSPWEPTVDQALHRTDPPAYPQAPRGDAGRRASRGRWRAVALAVVLVAGAAGLIGPGLADVAAIGLSASSCPSTPAGSTNGSAAAFTDGTAGAPSTCGTGASGTVPASSTVTPTTTSRSAGSGSGSAVVSSALVDVVSNLGDGQGQALGTGIVVSATGMVLTNAHVIEGATSTRARAIRDGRTYPATMIGRDETHDVALIQLGGASGLSPAVLISPSTVRVGDPVLAVGNAGGDNAAPVVTQGAITATGQSVTATDEDGSNPETLTGLLGTSARIAAGDSGGALVNPRGQVLGLLVAGKPGRTPTASSNTSGGVGGGVGGSGGNTVGYAIPMDQAVTVANRIVTSPRTGSAAATSSESGSSADSASSGGQPSGSGTS